MVAVLTRSLLASHQPIVAGVRTVEQAPTQSAAALAVNIDRLAALLNADLSVQPATPSETTASSTLHEILAAGHLHYIPGNRIASDDVSAGATDAAGIRLIGPAEVSATVELGHRRIDRLRFAAAYPAGRVTEPGDVVFCTSPRPAALVDTDDTSVVRFPARILHIEQTDPNGLLAEVLAADILAMPPGLRRWWAWPVRQVALGQRAALADALASVRLEQQRARERLARLDELRNLLMVGVIAGTLTLLPASAPITPETSAPLKRNSLVAAKTKTAVLPSTMKELKDTLWKAADKLRGSMDASQYKDVILGLVFLKYVSDAFTDFFGDRAQPMDSRLQATSSRSSSRHSTPAPKPS